MPKHYIIFTYLLFTLISVHCYSLYFFRNKENMRIEITKVIKFNIYQMDIYFLIEHQMSY